MAVAVAVAVAVVVAGSCSSNSSPSLGTFICHKCGPKKKKKKCSGPFHALALYDCCGCGLSEPVSTSCFLSKFSHVSHFLFLRSSAAWLRREGLSEGVKTSRSPRQDTAHTTWQYLGVQPCWGPLQAQGPEPNTVCPKEERSQLPGRFSHLQDSEIQSEG